MNWTPDQLHQFAHDRQQRLLGEAAAARLLNRGRPSRTWILRLLERLPVGRTAAHPCPPVGAPLIERR